MLIGNLLPILMRLTSVVLTSWFSSVTSKISLIVSWPWSNHVCVFVCYCAPVSVCNWFYKMIHGAQKQILVFFCLEIWILAWRSHAKIMELVSKIIVGTSVDTNSNSAIPKRLLGMCRHVMMTSSNENIFRIISPLCGKFIGHRWIPLTMTSDAELGCFLWSAL